MNKLVYFILLIPMVIFSEILELEEITVNSDKQNEVFEKEGYMQLAPMQKQITTKDALSIAGTNGDPIKALKSFAGVVSTNNDNGSEIFIHGSKPRETLFTLNHLPLPYLFHLGGLHSIIAPEMIDQIDAYLGGFDTTYGSMGAVVDITPKYPTGKNRGRVHIGLYDADFAYDAKLGEHTSLFLGGRRSYFDLIANKIIDELDKDKDDPDKKTTFSLFPQFYDAQFILSHSVGNNIFSLEAIFTKDELKLNDTIQKDKDPVAVGKIESKVEGNTIGVRWIYAGDDFSAHTLFYRKYTKGSLNLFDANYFVDNSNSEYGIYNENIWHLENHTLTLGGEITYDSSPVKLHITSRVEADFEQPISLREVIDLDKTFKAMSVKLFIQDIWDITEKNHFRYGARVWKTNFQEFDTGVDPRVAFVHNFDRLNVSMSVGKYSQFPDTLRVIEGFGNNQINTYESSNHYTLSFQKKLNDNSEFIIEPYFKTFQNLAVIDEVNKFEAIGKGEAYGVDITYKKEFDNFNFMVAYTFVKAKRQIDTKTTKQYRFEGDIPHTLQINGNYEFSNNWRFSTYLKYNSGAPYSPIVDRKEYLYKGVTYIEPIYGNPYSKRLPDNYDLDIQIGKTIYYSKGRSLEFSLELMNLTSLIKANVSSIEYNDKYEEDGKVEQLGFLPAIHINYKF